MAEVDRTASTASPAAGTRTGSGFELRLERGGAHVRLGAPATFSGLRVEHLDLRVPDIALPFDAGGGPTQFRHRLCDLDALTVLADQAAISAATARLELAELGLAALEVALRDGFAEVGGRLATGSAFTMRLGLLPGFDRGVTLVPYAPRIYGPAALPAAALPHLAARALTALGFPDDPLPLLVRRLLVSRGWKVPREGGVRLAAATVAPTGIRLAWARDTAAPPALPDDPDLLAAVEGARAFGEAEALAATGDWPGAREAWLASAAPTSHPFAADRLLSLLCLDERFHDEALDLAASWLQRRPGFPPALVAEAWVRLARGERERAAEALVALAEGAVGAGEKLAAVAAAETALGLSGVRTELTARAVEAALAGRRDHLPALRAALALARERNDRGAQVRAARRVLAYAPSDLEKARAHAELGELLLLSDPPGARLHLDRALRLAPDDAESLSALARACAAAGEHLRAVGALDRLSALQLRTGDRAAAVALALEAGATWDTRLGHVENALLRYREAAELGPRAAEAHGLAAGCAERLGRWTEAADHHAAALAVLDRTAPGAGAVAAAHHLALADVAERHLDDPVGAATHLEAAQAAAPLDAPQLTRLAALHRRLGRQAELFHALERLAPLTADPAGRAALLAEAGDLARGPLGRAEAATACYVAALRLDPACRPAIEGLAALARARGDGPAERDALLKLAPLARDRTEEASILDQLAAASTRAGDLSAAARALGAARRAAPSRDRLAAAVALARRTGDRPALSALLAEQAQAASAAGDPRTAVEAWRERAELLAATDPALALTALDEARRLHPGDPALLRLEAGLAEQAGDHHRALGALRTLLAAAPDDTGALALRAARAALAAGETPAARAHAEQALAAGEREAGDVLVGALEQGGDTAGQVEALSRAGRHLEAASLAERLGDGPAAVQALERAALEPGTAGEALRQLLRIHGAAGDSRAAAATLLAAARRAGGREGSALAWRAFSIAGDASALDLAAEADPSFAPGRAERAARRAAADPVGALADAEAALAGDGLDPARRPELLRLAADLAERTGQLELARRRLAEYGQAGSPTDSELARLGELHRAAGDLDGLASALARRAAIARPAAAPALHLELAELLARLGREPEALESWRAVLRFDPVALGPLRALLLPSRAPLLHDGERSPLLQMLAGHEGAAAAERAEAWDALAESRLAAGDAAGAGEARQEAARLRGDDDDGLERLARAAAAAGDLPQAARFELRRARRALAAAEPDGPDRLVEAGLALLEAGEAGEGEPTLREALALGPDPERSRAALGQLVTLAAGRSDLAAEAGALAALVPLLPTGERPDQLLRLSGLRATSGDLKGALEAAEQARTLAPRSLAAVRQARLAAAAAGDEQAVAARLGEEALLDAAGAGPLLLEQARLLARLGVALAADDAFTESLGLLPPDQGLTAEQVRLRRAHLQDRPASAPLERLAGRLEDPAESARTLLAAAALACEAGDGGTALRCARRAYGRSRQEPALAGPLLARLLYAQGSLAEALVIHRALFELGFPGFDEGEVVALSRQLAELALEAEEGDLALGALDRLLELSPQDAGAALERFRVDPDRSRAVTALEQVAGRIRSGWSRIQLLVTAAEGAHSELRDRRRRERLLREAGAEAGDSPRLLAELERRRQRRPVGPTARPDAAPLGPLSTPEAAPSEDQIAGPMTLEFPAPRFSAGAPSAIEPSADPGPPPGLSPSPAPEPEAPASAFEPIVGPRTLELPALHRQLVEPPPPDRVEAEPAQPDQRDQALELAHLAEAATTPASRAAAWLASASAAQRAGASIDEVRLAIGLACEAEPDALEPWEALAALELARGEPVAAARAHLAVSIRTEGPAASEAALVAARLFLEQGQLPDAVRALRAAALGDPDGAPPELLEATLALAGGAGSIAADLLERLEPGQLGRPAQAVRERLAAMVDASASDAAAQAPASRASGPPQDAGVEIDFGSDLEAALEGLLEAPPSPAETGSTPHAAVEAIERATPEADPILLQLRAEADASTGAARASALERLAGVLERQGEIGAAADALVEALAADPERELTWAWLDALVDGDPARQARVAELRASAVPATAPVKALELALAAARRDPGDVDSLLRVADLAGQIAISVPPPAGRDHLAELARLAWSIAAFAAPHRAAAPAAPPLPAALPEAARQQVALPGATGPLGQLLSLLTPYLEPLFPADLQRHGAGPLDRLVPPRAPDVGGPFQAAATLLSARAHAIFLVERAGARIEAENTRPPALIVPTGFASLPPGGRHFLAIRALDRLERAGALAGKFAPRDLGILLELACRFAGGLPPALGLPPARAGAFLSAMAQNVPASLANVVGALGPAAAAELAGADLEALADALQRTSTRVALLATGDPAGAFTALTSIDRQLQRLTGAEALRHPALRELAALALSEPFIDLRLAMVR